MQFDTTTTLIAIIVLISVLGIQQLIYWLRDPQSPWFGWFGATFVFGSVSTLIYLAPTEHFEFLAYGIGNALRLAAFAFLWQGTRMFSGRRPDFLLVAVLLCIWLAMCSIPAFLASLEARVVGTSVITALFLSLTAFELWRDRGEKLPSRMPAIAVYCSFAACMLLRVPLASFVPFPMGALPANATWMALFGLMIFTHASFLAGFTLSMTRERRELEQRRFSLSDPLTGLFNRRAFAEQARAGSRRRLIRDRVALLVLDLDHFKSINDRFGHEAGDAMLRHFAQIARIATRAGDMLFRMGGEEFCFILPGATPLEAQVIAERIRTRFAESAIEVDGARVQGTVSIGLATVDHLPVDPELLLAAGDAAVYEAKAAGRNRTVLASPALLQPRARRQYLAA